MESRLMKMNHNRCVNTAVIKKHPAGRNAHSLWIGLTRLTVVAGLLFLLPAATQAQYTYATNSDNTITITAYTGPGGAVTIPSMINNLTVTSLGDEAFYDTPPTSITIPASITNIGDEVFEDCVLLTQITVNPSNPAFVSVGGILFDTSQTTLIQYPPHKTGTTYTIPDSVISIGDGAFGNSDFLTHVTIPNGVAFIGNSAFFATQLPSLTIPNSVTSIGDYAFENCSLLTSLTIGTGLSSIGDYAFSDCASLTGLYFEGNAPSVEGGTFALDNNVTAYYLAGTSGWDSFDIPTALWNQSVPPPITTSYSVKESWSVTVTDPNNNQMFTRTGVATGTIQVDDEGNFNLINKTGAGAGATGASISYDGSTYTVDSEPVLYAVASKGSKFYAVVELSFCVVWVPLESNWDFSFFQEDDEYTVTGSSLSDLQGYGTAIDDDGTEYDVSSVATLTPVNKGGGKAPTALTFSETWADKVACTGSNSQGDLDCEPYSGGKFTVKAVITPNDFGAAIDPSQFNGDTTFDITVGNYSFSDTLSDAPGYVAGASKAKFLLSGDLCSAKDNTDSLPCPTKVYETITLTMSTKGVTVSISAKTGSDANGNTFESAIDADSFDGNATGPVTDTLSFEMDLGSLSVSSDILPVTGAVVTKSVTDKSGNQDTLSNVNIKGTLPATDLGQ
jgi:hypothetical protein